MDPRPPQAGGRVRARGAATQAVAGAFPDFAAGGENEVARDLATLKRIEVEARWIVQVPGYFDAVGDILTIADRDHLVCALVRRVEVDETARKATAILTHLAIQDLSGDDVPRDPPPRRAASAPRTETTA